jgi:uncharacterized LabA/DUF88 family protein
MRTTKFDIIASEKETKFRNSQWLHRCSLCVPNCASIKIGHPSSKRKILARDNKPRVRILLKIRLPLPVGRITALATVLRHFSNSWRCVQRGACPIFQEMFAMGANRTMSERNSSRIALFIDGISIFATARALGFDIDYKQLLKEFQSRGTLVRAYYYTAIAEDQEYLSIRPLIDWLDYNGYTVVTKATKEFIDASGRRKVKGNMDIELAVDAMELAEHVDQIVLFSGDGDFRSLVEAVQRRGVRVTVVSTISSRPPMIADDLRRQADVFIDLMELRSRIGRDPSERPLSRGTTERLLRAYGLELAENEIRTSSIKRCG